MSDKSTQKTQENISIPEFMKEQNAAAQADNEQLNRNANKVYKLMWGISCVWVLMVIIYITQFFGWSNLFLMMPERSSTQERWRSRLPSSSASISVT